MRSYMSEWSVKKNQSSAKVRTRLERSLSGHVPVSITRRIAPDEVFDGVVLDLAAEWVLLACLREGGYLNGYTVLRIADIGAVKTDQRFLPFLQAHQPWPPARPAEPIDLTGPDRLLKDIAQAAPIMTIYREARYPDALWIGSPVEWARKSAWILTIDPDMTWDDHMTKFKFKHLTRIDFSDDYTRVVEELAGPLPPRGPRPEQKA
jgi:hypothetical protein